MIDNTRKTRTHNAVLSDSFSEKDSHSSADSSKSHRNRSNFKDNSSDDKLLISDIIFENR
jgi:hypothetical protein